jgi:hypothetical protein
MIIYIIIIKTIFTSFVSIPIITQKFEEKQKEGGLIADFLIIFFGGIPRNHSRRELWTDEQREYNDQLIK